MLAAPIENMSVAFCYEHNRNHNFFGTIYFFLSYIRLFYSFMEEAISFYFFSLCSCICRASCKTISVAVSNSVAPGKWLVWVTYTQRAPWVRLSMLSLWLRAAQNANNRPTNRPKWDTKNVCRLTRPYRYKWRAPVSVSRISMLADKFKVKCDKSFC